MEEEVDSKTVGKCLKCPDGCATCDDLDTCTTCKTTHYLDNNSCLPCEYPCATCLDSTFCLTCF